MTAKKTATATKASPAPTAELTKMTAVWAGAEAPAKTA